MSKDSTKPNTWDVFHKNESGQGKQITTMPLVGDRQTSMKDITARYADMVSNCIRLFKTNLGWKEDDMVYMLTPEKAAQIMKATTHTPQTPQAQSEKYSEMYKLLHRPPVDNSLEGLEGQLQDVRDCMEQIQPRLFNQLPAPNTDSYRHH